jgi:hypothetical protein
MSTPYPPTPPPPQQFPPVQPKKTSPWVWIQGGCGVLVVLIVLALLATGLFVAKKVKDAGIDPDLMKKNPAVAMTKMLAAMNPDVEVMNVDEDRGIITVRDKKTGKSMTMNFEDIKRGKFVMKGEDGEEVTVEGTGDSGGPISIRTKDGNMSVGGKWNPPSWVPTYPGATVTASASGHDAEGASGAGYFNTNDSLEQVLDYFERELKGHGMQVTRNVFSPDGKNTVGSLVGTDEGNKRYVNLNYAVSDKGRMVHVNYTEKK